jgi:hypothetical protein
MIHSGGGSLLTRNGGRGWAPLVGLLVALVACSGPSSGGGVSVEGPREGPSLPNEAWRAPLDQVAADAAFGLRVPDHPLASTDNLRAAYLFPGGETAVLKFPAPRPEAPVRQPDIEIWEFSWEGGDPLKRYQQSIEEAPVSGKQIIDLNGVPALAVPANVPEDATGKNPAFLTFVLDRVEFEISGGDSIDDLVAIAKTMADG